MTAKKTPRLKNYTSSASESAIFDAIRKTLAEHKARRITFDYDDAGCAVAIQFAIEVSGQNLTFRLPARLENVEVLVKQSHVSAGRAIGKEALRIQGYKTAWANIRDWISAQMALVASGMTRTEEVFLPYLIVDAAGKTFFEQFAEQRALPPPNRIVITEV